MKKGERSILRDNIDKTFYEFLFFCTVFIKLFIFFLILQNIIFIYKFFYDQ